MASTSDTSGRHNIEPSSVEFSIPTVPLYTIYQNLSYINASEEDFTQYMAVALLRQRDFEVIREEMEKRGKRKTLTHDQIGLIYDKMSTSESFLRLEECVKFWVESKMNYTKPRCDYAVKRIIEYVNNLLKKKFKIQEAPVAMPRSSQRI